ncbi:ATP-binding protein [Streptomyces sp. NPDC086010]|uniref:ATP-binding protein n=1 Tax=Streptomyces sp. NPDC086010 TaxID=3365745 RepID=UPI0037D1D32C
MNGEQETPVDGMDPGNGPADAVASAGSPEAAGHGTVLVPPNAASARDAVTHLLASRALGPAGRLAEVVVADALLVTSELVTNAFRHGGGLTGFTAELTDEGLLLAVADASPDVPVTSPHSPRSAHVGGYGWPLVCRLAERVSITFHPGGKSIVALIALP